LAGHPKCCNEPPYRSEVFVFQIAGLLCCTEFGTSWCVDREAMKEGCGICIQRIICWFCCQETGSKRMLDKRLGIRMLLVLMQMVVESGSSMRVLSTMQLKLCDLATEIPSIGSTRSSERQWTT
jgi:hypothetical protein